MGIFSFENLNIARFLLYLVINAALFSLVFLGLIKAGINSISISWVILALAIFSLLYPSLVSHPTWQGRTLIFYIGFVAFCYCANFLDPKILEMLKDWQSFLGGLLRGVAFVLFGHLVAVIYIPIVVGINLILKKYLF